MGPQALDYRNQEARRKIREAAGHLAAALGLAPLGDLEASEKRQPAIAHMRELENVAALLEGVCDALEVSSHAST